MFTTSEPSLLTTSPSTTPAASAGLPYKKNQIFDASAGVGPIDVTDRHQFAPILKVIEMLRKTLLASRELRYPYLQALLNLYDDDDILLKKTKGSVQDSVLIPSIRPDRPTDEDICRFLKRHWPGIHLSHTGSSKTYVSPNDIQDENIHIASNLAFQWLSSAKASDVNQNNCIHAESDLDLNLRTPIHLRH
jgi:hypothetical protein